MKLSQAVLARKLGISRATQINYESDRRVPDGDYLFNFGKLGADTGYILFGARTSPTSVYSLAVARVLPLVTKPAGIDYDALRGILDLAAEDEALGWAGGTGRAPPIDKRIDDLVAALFARGELLGKVFARVGKTLHEIEGRLPPMKKADLVLMLFNLFKARGRVDTRVLDVAVRAAAG